jgi:hypothetical protein
MSQENVEVVRRGWEGFKAGRDRDSQWGAVDDPGRHGSIPSILLQAPGSPRSRRAVGVGNRCFGREAALCMERSALRSGAPFRGKEARTGGTTEAPGPLRPNA